MSLTYDSARKVGHVSTVFAVAVFTLGSIVPAAQSKPSGQTRSADLQTAVSDTPDPALLSDEITYTVTIYNSGPADAASSLGARLEGAGFTAVSSSQGTCTIDGSFQCSLGTLKARTWETVTIKARPSKLGNISLFTWAWSELSDPEPYNNSETEYTYVAATPITGAGCGGPFAARASCTFLATGGRISATAVYIDNQFVLACSPNYCPLLHWYSDQYEVTVVLTDPSGRVVTKCSSGGYCTTSSAEVITPGTPLTCTAYDTSWRWGAGAHACTG